MHRRWFRFAGLLILTLSASGLARAATLVNGAGATFPYPLYSKWFDEFHKQKPDVQINYQSIGSGGGIRQVLEGTVDFGATDGPMTDEQLAQAKLPILHLPTVLGAVVVTYNLEGTNQRLVFSSEAVAGIFSGRITHWNDPTLARDNPGVALPARSIVPVHRSDGSGTTYVFTDYLSKVDAGWAKAVGKGTSVNWPVGLGGKGNEGVSGLVKQTPNAIGYVELVYALQTKLAYGAIRNRAGNAVEPTLVSVTAAAAAAAAKMPADFRVSITDAAAADAYPIASFTWLLVPARIADPDKGEAIVRFLRWMLGDGQGFAAALDYAPLPPQVIELERKALEQIQVGR
ncbi:MAG: phosphate ABC transporter substrate-binding protein PstS [Candidatus Binatia bacterium]